jgi:dipeptide transport system ATP-binding protein
VSQTLLEVKDLRKTYELRRLFSKPGLVKALDGVSFTLEKGKTLAVVGESGCGKSTLAKLFSTAVLWKTRLRWSGVNKFR